MSGPLHYGDMQCGCGLLFMPRLAECFRVLLLSTLCPLTKATPAVSACQCVRMMASCVLMYLPSWIPPSTCLPVYTPSSVLWWLTIWGSLPLAHPLLLWLVKPSPAVHGDMSVVNTNFCLCICPQCPWGKKVASWTQKGKTLPNWVCLQPGFWPHHSLYVEL